MVFARVNAGAAAELLSVKTSNLSWPKGNDAINRRLIEAFGPKHGIGNKRCFSSSGSVPEPGADPYWCRLHVRQRCRSPGKARRIALRERKVAKSKSLAVRVATGDDVCDPLQVRLERTSQFTSIEVTSDNMHVAQVDSQRDRLDADSAQVAVTNQVNQSCLVRDVLEVVGEQPFVSPVRRRGDTKDAGTLEIPEHALITFRERMMGFVNDDQREMIGRKPPSPVLAGQCLHGGNDDRRLKAGSAFGSLDFGDDTGCS